MKQIINWYKEFEQKNPLRWPLIVLFAIILIGFNYCSNLSTKLNNNSEVIIGRVSKITNDYVNYEFIVNGRRYTSHEEYNSRHNYYTGRLNNKYSVGDKVLVRFYPEDPTYNLLITDYKMPLDSLRVGQRITNLDLKKLNFYNVE